MEKPAPPLALYIHWPFCKAKCPYCDFNSHVRETVDQAAWRDALLAELRYWGEQCRGRRLASIFFGGGTPSLMPPATAGALIEAAASYWVADADCEITLEANPTSVEAMRFRDFQQAGVNRVSMGIQALDDAALHFLGRRHSVSEALEAFALARKTFGRTSFDLIYARPGQTPSQWEHELREALRHAESHLSLYQLTVEPATPFFYRQQRGELSLPPETRAVELYTLTQAIMEEANLPAYEISNHAKPGEACRHNLVYWQGGDYLGVGPGAHGRITLDGARQATRSQRSPEGWLDTVEKKGHGLEEVTALSDAERVEEWLLMGLRLTEGIRPADFVTQSGIDPLPYLDHVAWRRYMEAGLLDMNHHILRATEAGRLVLNTLIATLLTI